MRPAAGRSSLASSSSSEVLPDPEGPAMATRVPAAMRKSTPRSTGTCRVPMA
jgi:hypothetical protein